MIRAAIWLVLLTRPVAAEPPPLFSLEGGRYFAECAAIFSLLTPEEPDLELSAQFQSASADLLDRVRQQHGTSFAQGQFEKAQQDWATREPSLQGNVDLAARLQGCRALNPRYD